MNATIARPVAIVLLAALVAAATGCAPAATTSPGPTVPATTTVAPTSTPVATSTASTRGPVTTPSSSSVARAAILKSAKTDLGLTGTVVVNQLFAQDGEAVGDLWPASGPRVFFALDGGPDAWRLAWSAPFGSSRASAAALTAMGPETFADLAAALDFTKKVSRPVVKVAAPTLSSFETFALKSTKSFAGASYTGSFTIQAKIAKDSKGVWWGNAIAEPTEAGLEPIGVWGHYSKGKWTGEIADFSTEDADAAYFPADVLAKLSL
jgi:hypothetical protein